MIDNNIILLTDSYKIGSHWNMYPQGTENDYAYYEARNGSKYPSTVFFGLQYLLKKNFLGQVVTNEKIQEAKAICQGHFGNDTSFYDEGWNSILNKHNGRLPISIKAVPEGLDIPINNVLFTVENTGGPETAFLTTGVESLLSHIYYPITIATQTKDIKAALLPFYQKTCDNIDGLIFNPHDFGFRSYTSAEAANIGGLATLIFNYGTDTICSLKCAVDYYNADPKNIAYSVPASQHSCMTALGESGELSVLEDHLEKYPNGILSEVADSYDIYRFVTEYVCGKLKNKILARNGIFVVRPDSVTPFHTTKTAITLWVVENLYKGLGGSINSKGYKVINKAKCLFGDGLAKQDMIDILDTLERNGYSADNIATFGCGSGLIQKGINRDVCRFAFKSSAQKRGGIWHDVQKKPLDTTKISKSGRLKLIKENGQYLTVGINDPRPNKLVEVFRDGELLVDYSFDQIRKNAQI